MSEDKKLYHGIIRIGEPKPRLKFFTVDKRDLYDQLLEADHYQKRRITDHYWSSHPVRKKELKKCMRYQMESPVLTPAGWEAFLERHKSELEELKGMPDFDEQLF